MKQLNRIHFEQNAEDLELEARIQAYELRLQDAEPGTGGCRFTQKESEATRQLYGFGDPDCDHFAHNCLLARRLVERGVRFVQLYGGGNAGDDSWDAHGDIEKNHRKRAAAVDKPIRGLLKDLKGKGLLDSTLVVWHTEFGRCRFPNRCAGATTDRRVFPSGWLAEASRAAES